MKTETTIERMKSAGLGLARGTIGLTPYDPAWDHAFEFFRELLANQHGCKSLDVFHVGSTAVPGALAKPILDILIVFDDEQSFETSIKELERLGHRYKGAYGIEGRHFFTLYNEDETFDYLHVHAFHRGHAHVAQLLQFRDSLRENEALRDEYSDLKRALQTAGVSRQDYPDAKSEFIRKAVERASE